MADLKETDVEKAGKGMLPGGSRRALLAGRLKAIGERRAANRANATFNSIGFLSRRSLRASERASRRDHANTYLRDRTKRIRKSADPINTLYSEIEKARSAFSGGSSKAFNRVGRIGLKAIKDGDTSRFSRASSAQRYLARRKRNAFHGGENWRTSLPRLRGGKYK